MKKAKVIFSILIALFLVIGIVFTVLSFIEAGNAEAVDTAEEEQYGTVEIFIYYGLAVAALFLGLPILKKCSGGRGLDNVEAILGGCKDLQTRITVLNEDKKLTKAKAVKLSITASLLAERADVLYCDSGATYYLAVSEGLNSASKMLSGDDPSVGIMQASACIEQIIAELNADIERENIIRSANGG